jgi:hypothetical protein
MLPRGSTENSLHWYDGHIPYRQSDTVVSDAVAGIAHLYIYGASKWKFVSELLGRPIQNLEDFGFPSPNGLKPGYNCGLSCHRFPSKRCASRNALLFSNGYCIISKKILCYVPQRKNTSYRHVCFSGIKQWSATCLSVYSAMYAKKRLQIQPESGETEAKRKAP